MTAPEGFELDLRRVPHEISWSMDHEYGLIPEMVEPGLVSYREPEGMRITDRHNVTVALVPWHRIAAVDTDMLIAHLEAQEPSGDVDQALAAVRVGDIHDAPDADVIVIELRKDRRHMILDRSVCVPGWPDEGGR